MPLATVSAQPCSARKQVPRLFLGAICLTPTSNYGDVPHTAPPPPPLPRNLQVEAAGVCYIAPAYTLNLLHTALLPCRVTDHHTRKDLFGYVLHNGEYHTHCNVFFYDILMKTMTVLIYLIEFFATELLYEFFLRHQL